jgi:hypothetical protein
MMAVADVYSSSEGDSAKQELGSWAGDFLTGSKDIKNLEQQFPALTEAQIEQMATMGIPSPGVALSFSEQDWDGDIDGANIAALGADPSLGSIAQRIDRYYNGGGYKKKLNTYIHDHYDGNINEFLSKIKYYQTYDFGNIMEDGFDIAKSNDIVPRSGANIPMWESYTKTFMDKVKKQYESEGK